MEFPFPPLSANATLLPFILVALSMVAVTIFLLGKVLPADGRPPLLTQMTLALAVLFGGSVLLIALLFVFLNPDGTTAWTWVLLAFNFMMMAPAGLWFVSLIAFKDRRIDAHGWEWPAAIASVTTGSEAIMGVLFVVGGGSAAPTILTSLALGLSSVWFFWSMAAVMVALVVWAPLSRVERSALLALLLSAVVAPWVTTYPTLGGMAMAGLMVAIFVLLLRYLLRGAVAPGEAGLLFGLAGAFLAMAIAGFFVAADGGADVASLAFGATMGVVMAVEIAYLVRRYYRGELGRPWVVRAVEPELAEPATGHGPAPVLDSLPRDGPSRGHSATPQPVLPQRRES